MGKRKKRKQAIQRSNSTRALARDVEGFRARITRTQGRGTPWTFGGFGLGGHGSGHTDERLEGLDERGEAPPPYAATGSKPPSLRSVDIRAPAPAEVRRSAEGEAVELRRMSGDAGREANNPPEYHAAVGSEDIVDVTRPSAAVTASDRFGGSMRRLLNSTGSTTHS